MRLGVLVRSPRVRITAAIVALALVAFAVAGARLNLPPSELSLNYCSVASMTDADMSAMSAKHYAASPAHGVQPTSAQVVAADTFLVSNYIFNADHNVLTSIDEVHINPGQYVLFKWVNGIHTTTSGNPGDGDSGSLWDSPINSSNQEFLVYFPAAGTFPFQCLIHGFDFGMVGTVVVDPLPTPTSPTSWGRLKARYR